MALCAGSVQQPCNLRTLWTERKVFPASRPATHLGRCRKRGPFSVAGGIFPRPGRGAVPNRSTFLAHARAIYPAGYSRMLLRGVQMFHKAFSLVQARRGFGGF